MDINNLKKKYDKESITTLQNRATSLQKDIVRYKSELIEILYYLDDTKRFRENKVYKNSTFETYLNGMYNMAKSTYLKEKMVVWQYRPLAETYGIGKITKVFNKCDTDNAHKAVKEIERKQMGSNKPLEEKVFNKIIEKYAKPKSQPNGNGIKTLESDNQKLQKEVNTFITENTELAEQIKRLKKTIRVKDAQIKQLEKQLAFYRDIHGKVHEIASTPEPVFNQATIQ